MTSIMIKIKMMTNEIDLTNIYNSLIYYRNIEIFKSMFDFLKFESSEIREMIVWMRFNRFKKFADLMKTEKVEIEHLKIKSFENENMQWSSIHVEITLNKKRSIRSNQELD